MSENEKIEYKVILLGNSGVGKTSLFKKIITGEFFDKNISTIGMDKRTLQVEVEVSEKGKAVTKPFDISLVDTAGEERFKAITKTYYKESDGILLIYDVTNKESFLNVKNWIDSIYESLGNHENSKYIIILIGNKIDLIGVEEKVREVTEEEAKKICKDNNFNFVSVDVDENPELSEKYGVQGLPFVLIYKKGEKVFEFVGSKPEKVNEAVEIAKKE